MESHTRINKVKQRSQKEKRGADSRVKPQTLTASSSIRLLSIRTTGTTQSPEPEEADVENSCHWHNRSKPVRQIEVLKDEGSTIDKQKYSDKHLGEPLVKTKGRKGPRADGPHGAGCTRDEHGTSGTAWGETLGWPTRGRTMLISGRHPRVSKLLPKSKQSHLSLPC